VNEAGVPDNGARNFQRKGNLEATSTIDPEKAPDCKPQRGKMSQVWYTSSTAVNQIAAVRRRRRGQAINWNALGSPSSTTEVSQIQYTGTTSAWSGVGRSDNFAAIWWGTLFIKTANNYRFWLYADDYARIYGNNDLWHTVDYNSGDRYTQRALSAETRYNIRIEYYDGTSTNRMQFRLTDTSNRVIPWTGDKTGVYFESGCDSPNQGGQTFTRSFFVDLNGNGLMDYPECRRRRTSGAAHRRRGQGSCTEKGNEFTLRDIYAQGRIYNPAGGINYEFVDKDGKPCDILRLKHDCKPADAGTKQEGALAMELSKFCDVPAALYQVPVQADGKVPADFGAVTAPMPIWGYNQKAMNFRAKARAEFGSMGHGTYLFCQDEKCTNGNHPHASQGQFTGIKDEAVFSSKEGDNVIKSRFYPQVGGSTSGAVPSSVNTRWTQAGTQASGNFNTDILKRYRTSTNQGSMYAKDRVWMDSTRGEGVTCLNGKYVYARKNPDGSRPIVSTVREALNRNGPTTQNGQWACRYVGVHCNANNCNNNGNTEIAGPFVEPKIKAKSVKPTEAPTDAPTDAPTEKPDKPVDGTPEPAIRRRRRGKGGKKKGGRRRKTAAFF
jgi:hypothetical protein